MTRYPVGPKDVLQKYLQALKADDREKAGQYSADLSLLPMPPSKPCTIEIGRLIRENSSWQIKRVQEGEKKSAFFEVTFEQPDLKAFLSKLSRENIVAAMHSKETGSVSEKLCEIVARELAVLSKNDICSLPRKNTIQYFTLKEFENQWKITGRTNAK